MSGSKSVKYLRDKLLLFRNEDYIAINKPLGIETISGREVPRALRSLLDEMNLVKSSCPVPINSMKKTVSGVQLLSLNVSSGVQARTLMKDGQFWRCKYWGIVSGRIKGRNSEGVVNVPLKDGKISSEGINSITHWKILKYSSEAGLSLLEFEPRTLVDDQILIHCESVLRCPVLLEYGLHLVHVDACLPDNFQIKAPVLNEFKNKMQSLGWL